jgi:hypothetical protein
MSQGNDFANYPLSNAEGGASEEVWFVAVASDDIKQMNVDQLDEAFRLGIITSATAVWTEGMDAWAPLGQVADLDGDASGETRGDADQERASAVAPSGSRGEQEISQTLQSFGGGYGAVTMQSAHNSFVPGPSSFAPVTSSYAPSSPFGQSTGPVALNVDEDAPAVQRGRRFRPERWALGAAAVIAIGVAVFNNMDLFSSSSASASTQAPAPVAAAHPYDGADGADRGAAKADAIKSDSEKSGSATEGTAASKAMGDAPIAAPAAKAAAVPVDDDAEPPASGKSKAADKDSLKGSFSKAFNKKIAAKSSKAVKPRKASTRERATTKSRATKSKKPGVARSQSAFDPLNDSLP